MSKFFSPIKKIGDQPKVNCDKLLRKAIDSYNGGSSLIIDNLSELEYLWNAYPFSMESRKNFIYPFDQRMSDISNISYSKKIKDICAEIFLTHFENSKDKNDLDAELILKNYFSENIDYLKEVKRQVKLKSSEPVIDKWIQYGLYYSCDPKFYEYCMRRIKKEKGYLDKKYKVAKFAVQNRGLSQALNKMISLSLTKRRAKDLCWHIKYLVDKRLGVGDRKHFYNLKHNYKKKYADSKIISDEECRLCVLLALRRGEEICDIITSFLPEKHCVFIFPLCLNKISKNNLKRRSIIK